MAKSRRSTKPPERTSKPDAARPSRTTIEVRPSWLEDPTDQRPTYERVTTEVDPAWLETESRPPTSAKAPSPPPKRKAKPPPLPTEPDADDEPQRSAMPPPLPPPPKKRA